MTEPGAAIVVEVRVGTPRTVPWLGHELTTSAVKDPVDGPVRVLDTHLDGDQQADPKQHGGPDKAVYAYAEQDALWWGDQLGRPGEVVQFGQNLTTRGVDLGAAVVGEVWHVGTAVLQVSEPRTPCWKLGYLLGDARFPRRFAAARRTGVLLRVLRTGALAAGDPITITARPAHGVTIDTINDVYYRRDADPRPVFDAVELAAHWREWASHRTVWHLADERNKGVHAPHDEEEAP